MEGSFREGLMHLRNTPVLSACYALGTVQVFTGKATLTWACESEEAENGVCSTVQNPQKHEDACRECLTGLSILFGLKWNKIPTFELLDLCTLEL